jgi:hydrogenase expression/formation protein HypE
MFATALGNPILNERHDGALVKLDGLCAFSTDSFVVKPLFFPGGDIGSLAVNGTVNDVAMCGAKPEYLSLSFIFEEGFSMEHVWNIVQSISHAATEADVQIVTGDTKVVDRGLGDGVYINTSGIGSVYPDVQCSPRHIRPGDRILLSGDIGRHGIAIMAAREGLAFETTITSDCAPLNGVVQQLIESGVKPHCMRDATRGGVATVLVELAASSHKQMVIDESIIPVDEQVHAACELLGLDPLYVANEGRFILVVDPRDERKALDILRAHNSRATVLGSVGAQPGPVLARNALGSTRVLDMLSGEQLPRIC